MLIWQLSALLTSIWAIIWMLTGTNLKVKEMERYSPLLLPLLQKYVALYL